VLDERPFTAQGKATNFWALEKLGWAHDVRWPSTARIARLRPAATE
jgi:hypothetical protein